MKKKPCLSDGFLLWIEQNNFKEKTILEIGSGYSTLFFSKNFKHVYSYENDKKWIRDLKKEITNLKIENIDFHELNKDIFNDDFFLNLVKNVDVFLIDNNPNFITRDEITFFIENNKRNESIVVLDNGEWHLESYEFLRKRYYCLDFIRIENKKLTQTSVFYHPRNKMYEINKLI